ncbi:hypothetical protein BDN70DRAFT_885286 [Pholiota conissans]|uniref:Uncharacterized protein n=1 Tax=Pholiota conissans TaxID=109636 RepID=A0A9P6CUN0_9AGAR|nr:hypothetical protein BDN70DRAFT_885286 [Pholiota conissans]
MSVPTIDENTEPTFTCRVWFKEAIRILNNSGYISCPDVNQLEVECKAFAVTNQPAYPSYGGYKHFIAHSSA